MTQRLKRSKTIFQDLSIPQVILGSDVSTKVINDFGCAVCYFSSDYKRLYNRLTNSRMSKRQAKTTLYCICQVDFYDLVVFLVVIDCVLLFF